MSRTSVDEPKLLAAAVLALLLARGSAKAVGLVALLCVVAASVAAMTIGVLLLKLVAG